MKLSIFLLPLFIFLQTGSCGDDTVDDGGSINENFVEFLGVRNEANGGCNQQSTSGSEITCTYAGAYTNDGFGYAIAITHTGVCRTATFNLRDNIDQPGNAYFIIQVTENGVAVDTYLGFSGTVNLSDSGSITTMEINGTVVNTVSGDEETISGYMECAF